MKELMADEMLLQGGGRCGGAWSSIAVEGTFAAAGAFIGFGLSAANPVGALWGARAGLLAGSLLCRTS